MITVKLPQKAEKLLADMAKASGRTIDQVAVEAILEAIEDWQDARIAEERLRDDDGVRIPLEEVIRKLELREAEERRNLPLNELACRVHAASRQGYRAALNERPAAYSRVPAR
ncbi:DUF6290 family protein [Mesorhizobium sp. M00.F.Ca.ET.216.01.1.1]|uniref:DUF6290 family protein n=1 Tax=Mesorhizobium sp. M00.F.Ca.ET.216.01.1.1 TaxID=2500528 RepID=UPI001671CE26|nr:DUF6290 family protein [Mesorhizobium sp. M00.F.Ca.ET.216.01.1.1]